VVVKDLEYSKGMKKYCTRTPSLEMCLLLSFLRCGKRMNSDISGGKPLFFVPRYSDDANN
jgi:hypothetical protein